MNKPTALVPQLWEQMAGEPGKAFAAFKLYRDMIPPRRARSIVGYSTAIVSQWYNDWKWPERVDAYDAHMERIALAEREAMLRQKSREVSAEHLAALQTARHTAQIELDKLLATVKESDGQILKPGELIKLLETVVRFDRLVRGESTDTVEHKSEDLSRLSIDELRKLREIQQKLKKDDES